MIEVVSQREEYDYEIICVNDSLPDNVLSVLKRLAKSDMKIKVVDLSKNMGKHAAVMAGFLFTKGDYMVNIDDDFQCPAYELWKLVDPVVNDECDYSMAYYPVKKQSLLKNIGSDVNTMMTSIMLGKPKGLRFENFSVMKRFVMEEIVRYDKPYPYLEELILRVTRRIKTVPMEERSRGDEKATGFTIGKSLSLWINGFTAVSVKPLRIATIFGAVLAFLGFALGIYFVIRKIIHPEVAAGYTSFMALQLLIGGIIMIMLGLIGEYIGRIYICINNSPQYVIRQTINMDKKDVLTKVNP